MSSARFGHQTPSVDSSTARNACTDVLEPTHLPRRAVIGSLLGGTCLFFSMKAVEFLQLTYLMVFGAALAIMDTPVLKSIKARARGPAMGCVVAEAEHEMAHGSSSTRRC